MRYLSILGMPEIRRLILASFVKARTALQLADLTGIPIAKCYRLIWRLRAAGLMAVEAAFVSPNGRTKLLFRSRLPGLELFLRDNQLMGRIHSSPLLGPSEGG
ncbi:MAG: hypothetical protein V3U52_01985 [Thermoplasmata archaeon]